ncbi:hypothetical protein H4219_000693 [Mycoemilia scoparia]|uniref:Ubiquitin-like domain-containing protein n=1 Tax=Mycoemilia scoparia TaxID=417184 RepID=A0A9W8DX11_9FUNG|nr:hypothetical protein H4219_000693 [Mycoemilia scoparia]
MSDTEHNTPPKSDAPKDAQNSVKDEKPANTHINLRVISPDSQEICFKIKKHTRLEKLMNAYCDRTNRSRGSIRFLFDGDRINAGDTPEKLEMEENDAIDAMVEQVGGYYL